MKMTLVRTVVGCAVLLAGLAVLSSIRADDDPFGEDNRKVDPTAKLLKFDWSVSPPEPKVGQVVKVTFTGTLAKDAHTYPLTQLLEDQSEDYLIAVSYLDTKVFKPLYPIKETPPKAYLDVDGRVRLEHWGQFTWAQEFLVQETKPGKKYLSLALKLQVCDEHNCYLGMQLLDVPIVIDVGTADSPAPAKERFDKPPALIVVNPGEVIDPNAAKPSPPSKDGSRAPAPGGPPRTDNPKPPAPTETPPAETGLLAFLGLAVFWGAVSLLTPCVFPMIPITVSFFIKQAEAKKHSPLLLALIYSGTIATVLTIAGVFLIQVIQPFSQHPLTNLFLAQLFIVFALSLFGMYEIVVPSRLVNFVYSQEQRGGLVGTVFMALTFSIISFTCVAPFYGGFIGLASSSQGGAWWSNPGVMLKLGLGALAYSVTFASPFFLLALFPTLLRALPKSGSWMNTVKVVMGFLELAAAVKLLRAAELAKWGQTTFLTFDVAVGLYIALAFACGLYLLKVYRLPHDHGAKESLGVLQLLFSIAFIALGFYLLPALFRQGNGERQRPSGRVYGWVEAFLLREDEPSAPAIAAAPGVTGNNPVWLGNFAQALERAEKEKKLVFIDFTGVTCANCNYNAHSIFPRPDVRAAMNEYVLVELYCDTVPPRYQPTTSGPENERFRDETFHNAQLPLYAIVKPIGGGKFEKVGVYDEGLINSPDRFVEFLKKPLQNAVAQR